MKVAINGFGRIGRQTLRQLLKLEDIQVVAVNDLGDPKTLTHLFKYDSIHGPFPGGVKLDNTRLMVDGKEIAFLNYDDPSTLPWEIMEVDIVLECTGVFRNKEAAGKHLEAGASKVIISAPPKSEGFKTVVLGVNEDILEAGDRFISNASCTTNCFAPVVKVLHDKYGIRRGMMSTVHAYTSSQNLLDAPHTDLRRARAAAENIVPTSTGAAKATELVIPAVKGKITATAMRVPVPCGSIIEFITELETTPEAKEINELFKEQSEGDMKGVIFYCPDPIVSSDIVGNPNPSIFDAGLTAVENDWLKVVSWYDNEAGYAAQLAALAAYIGKLQ